MSGFVSQHTVYESVAALELTPQLVENRLPDERPAGAPWFDLVGDIGILKHLIDHQMQLHRRTDVRAPVARRKPFVIPSQQVRIARNPHTRCRAIAHSDGTAARHRYSFDPDESASTPEPRRPSIDTRVVQRRRRRRRPALPQVRQPASVDGRRRRSRPRRARPAARVRTAMGWARPAMMPICQPLQTNRCIGAVGPEQGRICKESPESTDGGQTPGDTRSDISETIFLATSSGINARQQAALGCHKATTPPASHAPLTQLITARHQQSETLPAAEVSA